MKNWDLKTGTDRERERFAGRHLARVSPAAAGRLGAGSVARPGCPHQRARAVGQAATLPILRERAIVSAWG
jgi:hypothetical protein